jgi:ribosome-associated toxin RatA of RatAB toxin-antitoxin module
MNCENSIVICAPLDTIFAKTSNIESWPKSLPHYRWVRVIGRDGNALIVKMAARRGWLPIQWTSRFEVDAGLHELRFHHLKAFTRGMDVKWSFTPTSGGVLVRITHELNRRSAVGQWFAERVLAKHFIQPVAARTLRRFKQHLEQTAAPFLVSS